MAQNAATKLLRLNTLYIPDRTKKYKIYAICYTICTHWTFFFFISMLIIANTIVLAFEKYPGDPTREKISDLLNTVFTWAFVAEMIIKLIGLGFRVYARDNFNLFDAAIVVLAGVDMIVVS